MQSCASAAKLRGGGPILYIGMKAMVCGTPPPRTVIGDPSPWSGSGRNRQAIGDVYSIARVHHAGRMATPSGTTPSAQPPQRDQQLAGQCHNHGLAGFRGLLRTPPIPLRQSAVLLEQQESPRQLDHATAHTGIARSRHPFLAGSVPLRSGEPVSPP